MKNYPESSQVRLIIWSDRLIRVPFLRRPAFPKSNSQSHPIETTGKRHSSTDLQQTQEKQPNRSKLAKGAPVFQGYKTFHMLMIPLTDGSLEFPLPHQHEYTGERKATCLDSHPVLEDSTESFFGRAATQACKRISESSQLELGKV